LLKWLLQNVARFLSHSSGSTEVTDFRGVVLGQEDVQAFDVPVNDVLAVQVLYSQAELNEHLPDEVLYQILAILLADVCVQVSVLAILLDDVDC
jgi:hypothetical protein